MADARNRMINRGGRPAFSTVDLGGATLYGTRGGITPEDIRSSLKLLGKTRVSEARPAPLPAGAAPAPILGGSEVGGYGWAQGLVGRRHENYLAKVATKASISKYAAHMKWSNARRDEEYKKENVYDVGTKRDPYDPTKAARERLKTGKTVPYKIGTVKEFKEGGKIVTKQYTPAGKWEKMGESPRWDTKPEYTVKTAHTRLSAISASIAKLQKANTTSALDVLLSINNPGYVPPADGGGYEAAKSAAIKTLQEEAEYVSSYLPKDEGPKWPSPMGLPDWRAAFRGDAPPATRRPEELSDEELMAMING